MSGVDWWWLMWAAFGLAGSIAALPVLLEFYRPRKLRNINARIAEYELLVEETGVFHPSVRHNMQCKLALLKGKRARLLALRGLPKATLAKGDR